MDVEAFLEEVRLYPFLYDKTLPNYKDKEEKMNRWDLIGALFGLTNFAGSEQKQLLGSATYQSCRCHFAYYHGIVASLPQSVLSSQCMCCGSYP
ncbi:hypothetical protein HPB52_002240 [Rhipicephalus sanguineus]|uniref:MADF domain-containing protein n=1 Tax=Rhipicephalus sanguineus TaxID=34632 RepID=A0A9D4T2Q4_RHISA|nr:hypothetical protein HPB52_002240 [Rhipicephalus sanguineus]